MAGRRRSTGHRSAGITPVFFLWKEKREMRCRSPPCICQRSRWFPFPAVPPWRLILVGNLRGCNCESPSLGLGPPWGWGMAGIPGWLGARRGASPPPKPRKERVRTAGSEVPALLLPKPRSSGCCQNCGCLSATLLIALGKQGEKVELLFSGTYSSGYLCPLVVFGLRQLFFLPVSVTDALGIFPGHIHLASSCC